MKRINWGFIGCGEATEKKSGPAFGEVPGSQVVAVMSRNADKARLYAERHHIRKWYTDAQELVDDPDVDAIYIATPPSSHATFAIMAMRSGKPCYVEKPLAACYEDCLRINRISEQTGVPCFVAYYRRYLPYFQKVRELVEDGTLGKILNVQIRFSAPPREFDNAQGSNQPWRVQPLIAGGGYFYDLAPPPARPAAAALRVHHTRTRIPRQPRAPLPGRRHHQRIVYLPERHTGQRLVVLRGPRERQGRPHHGDRR